MKRLTARLATVIGLFALLAGPAAAERHVAVLMACGNVRAHVAATATAEGSLIVGSRSFRIAAGTAPFPQQLSGDMCVNAGVDASGIIVRPYNSFVIPPEPLLQACSVVRGHEPATATTQGSITLERHGRLVISAGADLGSFTLGSQRCVGAAVDRASGDFVALSIMSGPRLGSRYDCGMVMRFLRAGPRTTGELVLGTATYRIAAGVAHNADPAGPWFAVDTTSVGTPICVNFNADGAGVITDYWSVPMGDAVCDRATAFTPATSSTAGSLTLSYYRRPFRLPPGTTLPSDTATSSYRYCFRVTTDAAGDPVITAAFVPPPGGVSGPQPAPTNAPPPDSRNLPSTSTIALPLPGRAAAATEATTALQVCGTLREYRPATASAVGALTIGTRTYAVSAGTVAGNGGVTVTVGADLCVQATQGRTSGQLVYYLFFWMPPGDRVCGNDLGSTPTTTTIAADFGELTLRRGSGLAPGQGNERRCYAFEVDRTSGDLVATAVLPVRDIDRERISPCGTVKEYTRATAATSGSIVIGSRSYRVAAGVAYTGDPAGDRTDRTTVGSNMCLRATLGSSGEIVEYLTGAFTPNTGGVVLAYTPPSGGQSAIATLSYGSRYTIRIAAAVDAAVDLSRGGAYCFSTTVDNAGDMSANAVIVCGQGVATGPGPTTTNAPAPTSAAPSPTASATPTATPTPVAAASPSAEPATTTYKPVGPDPLVVAGVLGIAALGLLAVYLARRRVR